MKDATRAVRSGLTRAVESAPIHAGPVFVSTFHTPGAGVSAEYSYGRSHQPTWTALERALGELEVDDGHAPAEARVFGSGLAAVAAALWAAVEPGETVVVQQGTYFGTWELLARIFEPVGVTVRTLPVSELTDADRLRGAKLVWVETPGNPGLEIADVRAVVQAAHAIGARVAVDNTTATPLGQRPLELGADLSVCSDSKAMGGHSDLLLGHVAVRDRALLERIDRQRNLVGAIAGPMESWLLLRSLATLPMRLERMAANALAIAEFLCGRREITDVLYPGLQTHPGHATAAGQMQHFGPIVSFTLPRQDAAERFLVAAKLVTDTTSFGGITTTAERRARWGGDAVAPGFLRLSAGCEDPSDLLADLAQALEASR